MHSVLEIVEEAGSTHVAPSAQVRRKMRRCQIHKTTIMQPPMRIHLAPAKAVHEGSQVRHHRWHSRALARDVAGVNLLDPKYKVAPWWSASGDLTARTKGRTSPELHGGQPVEPLSTRRNVLLTHKSPDGLPRRKWKSLPVENSHSRPSNYRGGPRTRSQNC